MPRILDVGPRFVPAGAGIEITIRGAGFGGNKKDVSVHLGSTEAKVKQVSNGNIIAQLPGVKNLGDGVADGAWRGERGVRWQWTESKTPDNPATVWRERTLQSFDSSDDFSQAASSQLSGWFVPPVTSEYSFFVRTEGPNPNPSPLL